LIFKLKGLFKELIELLNYNNIAFSDVTENELNKYIKFLNDVRNIKKGGKAIIRNHKLKYLLKKIYKDIKILSLN